MSNIYLRITDKKSRSLNVISLYFVCWEKQKFAYHRYNLWFHSSLGIKAFVFLGSREVGRVVKGLGIVLGLILCYLG